MYPTNTKKICGFQNKRSSSSKCKPNIWQDISREQISDGVAGLERVYLSTETAREIVLSRKVLWKVMELEQKRQSIEGVYDPDRLSRMSEAISKRCRSRASAIGLMQYEVMAVLNEVH